MDQKLAKKNIRDGLIIGLISVIMAVLTLVAALIYIS